MLYPGVWKFRRRHFDQLSVAQFEATVRGVGQLLEFGEGDKPIDSRGHEEALLGFYVFVVSDAFHALNRFVQ
jgi:hypothetical protein